MNFKSALPLKVLWMQLPFTVWISALCKSLYNEIAFPLWECYSFCFLHCSQEIDSFGFRFSVLRDWPEHSLRNWLHCFLNKFYMIMFGSVRDWESHSVPCLILFGLLVTRTAIVQELGCILSEIVYSISSRIRTLLQVHLTSYKLNVNPNRNWN